MDFAKVMARKLIISKIKKKLKVDKFVNLKFTLKGNGECDIVVNLEHKPQQVLEPEEVAELEKHLGKFDMIEGEIEQTRIKFKLIKNGISNEIEF